MSVFPPEQPSSVVWTSPKIGLAQGALPYRRLIEAPLGSTHMIATMTVLDMSGGGTTRVHIDVNQLMPGKRNSESTISTAIQIVNVGQQIYRPGRVYGGTTLDLCVMLGSDKVSGVTVSLEIRFFSYQLQGVWSGSATGEPVVYSDQAPCLVALRNGFDVSQKSSYSATLKSLTRTVRPSSASPVRLLSHPRYAVVAQKTMCELELSYEFNVSESCDVSVSTPLDECTYGYVYHTLVTLYSGTREYLHTWGWGGRNAPSYTFGTKNLTKGRYLCKVYVRHDSQSSLDALKNMALSVEFSLKKAANCSLYKTMKDGVSGGSKVSSTIVSDGRETTELWIAQTGDLPSFARAGDVLRGLLYLNGTTAPVLSYPLTYVVQSTPTSGSSSSSSSNASARILPTASLSDKMEDAELNAVISFFSGLKEPFSQWERLVNEKLSQFSSHAFALHLRLVALRAALEDASVSSDKLLSMCEELLRNVRPKDVAEHFGKNTLPGVEEQVLRNQFTLKRDAMTEGKLSLWVHVGFVYMCNLFVFEALSCKVALLKKMGKEEQANETMTLLQRFADDSKIQKLNSANWKLSKQYGAAMQVLLNDVKKADVLDKDKAQQLLEMFQALKWGFWEEYMTNLIVRKYPSKFLCNFSSTK